jgi:uncharacterized protein (TIGR03435 family)
MNKLMLSIVTLAMLPGSKLLAQDITGTWQGTLQAGRELRTVIRISKADGGSLKAVLYSIDQGGQAIPASTISLQGSTVKMSVASIGGAYEGKLNTDGTSITGTWNQGAGALPLNLKLASSATAWAIPEPLPPPKLMPAEADPVFEVATIKPSKPEERFSLLVGRSGLLTTTGTSLSDLIKFAYDLHPRQITRAPAWLETEKYDVTAKPDTAGIPNAKQLKAMLQKLLADRFQLTFHRDKTELSVYAITVGKAGAKLANNESNPNGLPGFGGGGRGNFRIRNATIAEFAAVLQANILEKPVVDQTGFGSARYDFTLTWTPDAFQPRPGGPAPDAPPPPDNADTPPDIFLAFQQQLGLKLESTKAPVDVLVIDRVERPSDN